MRTAADDAPVGAKGGRRQGSKDAKKEKEAKGGRRKEPDELAAGATEKETKGKRRKEPDELAESGATEAVLPGFPIVGIGASAGGLVSFERFLRAMPAETGMAFVLIQHLDPRRESLMADLLSKHTSMPVDEVTEEREIEPDHVYVIPPDKFLTVRDGRLHVDDAVKRRGLRLPIDHFFRSLAEACQKQAICVVLSGTGSDGASGLRDVKAAGGLTLAQLPETAEHDGMPRSAIATGMVDFVLPIEEMPPVMLRHANHPCVEGDTPMQVVRTLGEQSVRVFERSRAEKALRESNEHLSLALEAGELGAWDWDLRTDGMTWSDPQFAMLGYAAGAVEPSYERWCERIHPEDRERVEAVLRAAKEQGERFLCQYRVVHPGGAVRWVEARGRCYADAEPGRMYGVLLDVNEHVKAETELRESDQRKDAFLATLGHELRNPLAALASGVELLRSGLGEKDREEVREMMARQADQMSSLLNDLLDHRRISRGEVGLRPQRIPVRRIVDMAVASVRVDVDMRRQALAVSLSREDLEVDADPVRLEQILVNLLSNAARFTESEGEIVLAVKEEGSGVSFELTDSGIGLSQDQVDLIFEPFYQSAKGSGGLGIGLSIVKQLAEMHGGSVTASSDGLGRGSRFRVWLPARDKRVATSLARAPAGRTVEKENVAKDGDLESLRVLVVDDHADTAKALTRLLSRYCHASMAIDAATALEQARAEPPDVVLLDLGLPDRSGLEVAVDLRRDARTSDARLIALTGFGDTETALHVRDAGFDDHMLKPVDFTALLGLLRRVSRARPGASGANVEPVCKLGGPAGAQGSTEKEGEAVLGPEKIEERGQEPRR